MRVVQAEQVSRQVSAARSGFIRCSPDKPHPPARRPQCILKSSLTRPGARMTQNPGKPSCPADLRELDLFEFAQSGRQAAGAVRVSQLPRMLNEVPAGAPNRDNLFT